MALNSDQLEHIAADLKRIVAQCYPDGKFPPEEAGHVFREMSREYARLYRVDVPEAEISAIARKLGYWLHTPTTLEDLFADRTFPASTADEFVSDPWQYC